MSSCCVPSTYGILSKSMSKSSKLWDDAKELLPGGVNSPVRSGNVVGIQPPIIVRANGAHIYDVDGNRYIDLVNSWGALILGHRPLTVMNAVRRQLRKGTSYGATSTLEIELAKRIREAVPSMEKMRMVSSGTEATMSAIRLARGFTKRKKIIKFDGCYHGHADSLLVEAGSGDLIGLPYNDAAKFEEVAMKNASDIAAVIVEPIAANMGIVLPRPGFLENLREVTQKVGAVLIFDEIITGFRLRYGGVQDQFGIKPDLTCLGKIVGGGFPFAVYGGRGDIMDRLAPIGPVYQAGTLSGNPVAVAASLATLEVLRNRDGLYEELETHGRALQNILEKEAKSAGFSIVVNRAGSMLTPFFTNAPVFDYSSAKRSNVEKFARFYRAMIEEGISIPPSPFEAFFLSRAHDRSVIGRIGKAIAKSMEKMVQS